MTERTNDGLDERYVVDQGDPLDDELTDLFKAFDDVGASDALEQAVISKVLALVSQETEERQCADAAAGGKVGAAEGADVPVGEGDTIHSDGGGVYVANEPTAHSTDAVSAQSGGGARRIGETPTRESRAAKAGGKPRRARFRAIRVAAIAACLAMALSGGVAYAVPSSHVTVTQNDAAIELGVNVFGITVSATSANGEIAEAIKTAGLEHASFEESLKKAVDAMESFGQASEEHPMQIMVDSGDPGQRERLERESERAMEDRGFAGGPEGFWPNAPAASGPEGEPAPSQQAGWQGGQPGGAPAMEGEGRQPEGAPAVESEGQQPGGAPVVGGDSPQPEGAPAVAGGGQQPGDAPAVESEGQQPDGSPIMEGGGQPDDLRTLEGGGQQSAQSDDQQAEQPAQLQGQPPSQSGETEVPASPAGV